MRCPDIPRHARTTEYRREAFLFRARIRLVHDRDTQIHETRFVQVSPRAINLHSVHLRAEKPADRWLPVRDRHHPDSITQPPAIGLGLHSRPDTEPCDGAGHKGGQLTKRNTQSRKDSRSGTQLKSPTFRRISHWAPRSRMLSVSSKVPQMMRIPSR